MQHHEGDTVWKFASCSPFLWLLCLALLRFVQDLLISALSDLDYEQVVIVQKLYFSQNLKFQIKSERLNT